MAFFRKKTIKGHEYFYYCVRVRSGKKKGGTGKVKSYDYCTGTFPPYWKRLPYFCHIGEIDPREYATAYVQWGLTHRYTADDEPLSKFVEFEVFPDEPYIKLRSLDGSCDLRKFPKQWRSRLKSDISDVFYEASRIERTKERIRELEDDEKAKLRELEAMREKLKKFKADPDKRWDEREEWRGDKLFSVWTEHNYEHYEYLEGRDIPLAEDSLFRCQECLSKLRKELKKLTQSP